MLSMVFMILIDAQDLLCSGGLGLMKAMTDGLLDSLYAHTLGAPIRCDDTLSVPALLFFLIRTCDFFMMALHKRETWFCNE